VQPGPCACSSCGGTGASAPTPSVPLTLLLALLVLCCCKQVATKDSYDNVIAETEAAYLKARVWLWWFPAVRVLPAWPAHEHCQSVAHAPCHSCCLLCANNHVWPFPQILESSQTLLTVLKRENISLTKQRQAAT
jgi:hypothetical protein